jgi:pSer/pThr/pTyr-binding forkhead associated (FHA) protein/Tfp pilus assembly protein PilF
MTTSGKPRAAPTRAQESDDRTNPGGPAPEVLAEARREASEGDEPAAPAPGDATLIYDKNRKTPANEAPRLLVIAGPRNGSEFLLTEVETSIGRGSDSVVVIPDISVSRKHVVIAREADKYVLIDQGSGNGTRLNGRSVDRSVLQSGDEIAMGDTVVKFLEPGGVVVKPKSGRVASPANAPRPSLGDVPDDTLGSAKNPKGQKAAKAAPAASPGLRSRGPLYAGVAVVLLVVFFVGAARKKRLESQQAAAARAQGEGRQLAQQRFEEGVRQLKDGRWAEARDKLRVAAELAPQDTDIQRYLERAEAEAPRALAIAQARTALGKRDFAQAKGALAGVPDDSALAEAAHELSQQLKAALDAAVREARVLVESGDAASALTLLDAVLAAEPGRADAQTIRDAAAGARRSAARDPDRERAAPKKEKPEPGPAPISPAASEILDSYLSGDIGTAMDKAENGTDARSQRLSGELKAFDAAWRDGLAKAQAKRLADAIRALEQADKIDKGLAPGKDSKLGKEVRRALGNLHYNLGVQGMSQEDTLGQAAGHLRAALAADPENGQAKKSLAEINDRAKEIYQRAYFEKDSEPDQAKKAFRLVAEALPPGDELGAKAKKWADKLDGIGQPAKASE